ncbi:MAG: hypothetical protein WC415_01970 [Patescibacteria group bacterium]
MSKYFDIKYDEKIIIKEMTEVVESLDFFKKNNIRIYFPFEDKNITEEVIVSQLEKDKIENNPDQILKEVDDFLKINEDEIKSLLERYNDKFLINKQFKVFLNYYGCDGYYYFPDTIVVNLRHKAEYIAETIIHEMIHLLIEDLQKNSDYSKENEQEVDCIFVESGLKKIFKDYLVQ